MDSRAVIQFGKAGFAVFPDILDEDEVCEISRQLVLLGTANAGTRRLLNEAWCLGLGQRLPVAAASTASTVRAGHGKRAVCSCSRQALS